HRADAPRRRVGARARRSGQAGTRALEAQLRAGEHRAGDLQDQQFRRRAVQRRQRHQPAAVARCGAGAYESESVGDAILRLRSEISVARSELQRIKSAPLPTAEIKAQIEAEVDRMAAAGTPRITVGPAGKVAIDWCDVQAFAAPGQARSAPSGSASQLACWWDRDAMIERLTAGIVDVPGSIPAAGRPQRIRESEAHIFALEVAEERLVVAGLDAGLEVHRRPDASPWAVLYGGEETTQAIAAEGRRPRALSEHGARVRGVSPVATPVLRAAGSWAPAV